MELSQHISKPTYRHATCQHLNMSTCKHVNISHYNKHSVASASPACLGHSREHFESTGSAGWLPPTLPFNLTSALPPSLPTCLQVVSHLVWSKLSWTPRLCLVKNFPTRVFCSKVPSVRVPHFIEVPGLQELQVFTRIPRF